MRARALGLCALTLAVALALLVLGQRREGAQRAGTRATHPTTPVGSTRANVTVDFSLVLDQPRPAALRRYLRELQDPESPRYRHFLSAPEFGTRFGVSSAAIARVRRALAADRLRVTTAYPQRTSLEVRGSAADVGRFLHVRFADFLDERGRRFHAPIGRPVLPRSIGGAVTAATGLSTRRVIREGAVPAGGLRARDIATAYNLQPLRRRGYLGQGLSIAIVSFDSFHEEDVAEFDRVMGIRGAPPVDHIPVEGGTSIGEGEAEVNLDIDIIRAIAPRARILNYEAPNRQGMTAATINRIVADGYTDIASMSWGKCDLRTDPEERRADEQAFAAAAARGINVFVASGDAGAYECQRSDLRDHRLSLSWPAASPDVIAVGGTTLAVRRDGSYAQELGWEGVLGGTGGGGGLDQSAPRPPWQRGRGVENALSTGTRQIPDVAASGDPASGWFTHFGGHDHQVGGTSAAAPFWAGSMLLISQRAKTERLGRLGYVNPILYRLAARRDSPFHDVVRGGNRHYDAGPGWDFSTGLGSPDVDKLADQIVAFLRRRPA